MDVSRSTDQKRAELYGSARFFFGSSSGVCRRGRPARRRCEGNLVILLVDNLSVNMVFVHVVERPRRERTGQLDIVAGKPNEAGTFAGIRNAAVSGDVCVPSCSAIVKLPVRHVVSYVTPMYRSRKRTY